MKTGTDNDDEASLWEVARAVDDGEEVDWGAAENSALKAQRPLVHQLKVISEVVAAHKEAQQSDLVVEGDPGHLDPESPPTTWGSLEIIEKIGEGAFGEVFRAREPQLDRDVALKLFHLQRLSPSPEISKIIEEGRLLAHVHHQNIVTVHGAKHHAGQVGIWMEFIDGSTLEDILTDQGPLSPEEAMLIGRGICRALAALHSSGVIHRDIKARNVMREEGGRIVLMDLGVSCEIDRQVSVKQYGTPLYAAPEVLLKNVSSHQSDIYSLGVLLFHLVTGDYPVSGRTLEDVCEAHQAQQDRLLRDLRPDLPDAFILIVEQALAPDPAQRFASAVQFEQALIDALGDRSQDCDLQSRELPSVAVLPFKDLSAQKDQDYFCEGLAEEIITSLAYLKSLRVVARSSAFAFKDRQAEVHEIGKQLKVETLLEGGVRKIGNRLHISAQLINITNGHPLWSEQYDGAMEDVFAIQDKITVAIVNNLRASFSGDEIETITKKHTDNVEAYNLFLKGRYLWNMGTKEDLEKAVEYYDGAIAKDSNYAPAYAGLAESYSYLNSYIYSPSNDCYQKAKVSALKAIEVDPLLAEAHSAIGVIKLWEWDWKAAKRSLQKAIELNPKSTSAHYYYAHYLVAMGRLEDAIDEMNKTLDADPLSRSAHSLLGVYYLRARRLEKARDHLHYALELQLDTPLTHTCLGQTYMLVSEYDSGLAELKKAVSLAENNAIPLAALGWGYAVSGQKKEALGVLEELKERRARENIWPFLLAKVYCGLGENDKAFAWLEKAVQEHDIYILGIITDETIDDLRDDPRYEDILHQMKLA